MESNDVAERVSLYESETERNINKENALELEQNKVDTRCGIAGFSPNWLQKLASKKSYLFVYGLLGLYETIMGTYYVGTLSTMEKRFRFPSALSGVLASSWNSGIMFAGLVVAYFGSRGHKTRWIASGILISSVSCFMRYIPHYVYGPGEDSVIYSSTNTSISFENLCNTIDSISEICNLSSEGTVAFTILIVSVFLVGFGTSPFYILGTVYLDDNSLRNKFPYLYSIIVCVRALGPVIGYLLASYTLSIFVNTEQTPPFGQNDQRWIGAWHLGWNPLGCVGIFVAFLMALFPRMLPRAATRTRSSKVLENSNQLQPFQSKLIGIH